jgi:hypothetical protein
LQNKTGKANVSRADKTITVLAIIAAVIFALYALISVFMLITTLAGEDKSAGIFGYSFNVNPNNAMEGTEEGSIPTGSMIITKYEDPKSLKPGMVVAYKEQGELFVGRFVAENPYAEGYYIVKADNNYDSYEVLMTEDNLLGVVVNSVDWMGDIALFAITPVGEVLTLWIPVAVAVLAFISLVWDFVKPKVKEQEPLESKSEVKSDEGSDFANRAEDAVNNNADAESDSGEPLTVAQTEDSEAATEAKSASETPVKATTEIEFESDGDEDGSQATIVGADGEKHVVYIRYRKSYMARLIQSDDELKQSYNFVKNELLSHKKVKSRVSFGNESFSVGRTKCAKLAIRGKVLWLYLNLDPKEYENTKYHFKDNSDKPKYKEVPLAIKLKTPRSVKHSSELIADMMAKLGFVRIEREEENFYMPYEENASLIERDLIKVYYSSDLTDDSTLVGANINEMLKNFEDTKSTDGNILNLTKEESTDNELKF